MNFRKTLKLSQLEGSLFAVMAATTENFILYYGVINGFGVSEIALLATVPLFLGALAQSLLPIITKEKHLSEMVILTISIQAIGAIGLFLVSYLSGKFVMMLAFASLYNIGGMSSTPLWLDWAKWLIPPSNFKKYISKRSAFTWWIISIMYLLVGVLVKVVPSINLTIIFLIGAIARISSLIIQVSISRSMHVQTRKHKPIKDFSKDTYYYSTFKKILIPFIILLGFFKMGVQVSGPFFIPYMNNSLKLNVVQFIFLTSLPYLGRAISMNFWGKHAYGFSALKGVILCSIYISMIPIWWEAGAGFYILMGTEIFSGVFWGGLELFQVIYIQHFERTKTRIYLGLMMSFSSLLGVVGALIGAHLLDSSTPIKQVFYLSSFIRIIPIVLLFSWLKRRFPKIISFESLRAYALSMTKRYH